MKRLSIVFVVLISALVFTSCGYFWRALVYQKVNIDDYKIFSNRTIKAGKYIPWKIASNYNDKKLSLSNFEQFMKLKSVAYLITENDEIVYENYWDNYSDSSLSNSFSAAKSIVSLLIGIAIDEGRIGSENDFVKKYIPEYDNETNGKLTIKHLLTMSSGLNWHESYANPWSKTTQAYYGTQLEKMMLKLKVKNESGKKFHYFSGDTELLSIVLRRTTGMAMSDYASDKLWKRIGAKHDALWCLDHENGIEKAYCCFNSNARDFARIGQLVLNNGKWNGKQIVSEKWLKKSFTPITYLTDESDGRVVDFYGYQWWLMNFKGHKVIYARGLCGQYIFAIPDENVVIVRLGHHRSKERINHLPADIYLWLNAAFDMLNL